MTSPSRDRLLFSANTSVVMGMTTKPSHDMLLFSVKYYSVVMGLTTTPSRDMLMFSVKYYDDDRLVLSTMLV
jgi:hypothetical protein